MEGSWSRCLLLFLILTISRQVQPPSSTCRGPPAGGLAFSTPLLPAGISSAAPSQVHFSASFFLFPLYSGQHPDHSLFFFFFNRKGWAFSFGTFSCESVQHSNTVRAFCEAPPTASVLPPFSLWPWLCPDSRPPFDGWTYSVTLSSEQENSDLCTSKAHSLWPAPCLWWP